jgi:nucleotide-binding universal stress UspA family protein
LHKALLIPLDGSPFAEQALPLAISIAAAARIPIHLLRVRSTVSLKNCQAAAEEYLEAVAAAVQSQLREPVLTHVLTDDCGPLETPPPGATAVPDVVALFAAEHDISTIVLATHGYGGVRRAWLGSVADSLVRMAPRPVLAVRPPAAVREATTVADRGIRHVLIPVDGSAASAQAVPYAVQVGSLFDARYTLLRAVSPLAWEIVPQRHEDLGEYPSPLSRRAVENSLEAMACRLRERGLEVNVEVEEAVSPAAAILERTEVREAGLQQVQADERGEQQPGRVHPPAEPRDSRMNPPAKRRMMRSLHMVGQPLEEGFGGQHGDVQSLVPRQARPPRRAGRRSARRRARPARC